MKKSVTLKHQFVESLPDVIKDGTLYVCMEFATASHRCCCGCGKEVVTPLSPTDWKLMFDGKAITLHPSIGNWGFPCRSHYWIRNNNVEWAPTWSDAEITEGRTADHLAKDSYYRSFVHARKVAPPKEAANAPTQRPQSGPWRKFMMWWRSPGE